MISVHTRADGRKLRYCWRTREIRTKTLELLLSLHASNDDGCDLVGWGDKAASRESWESSGIVACGVLESRRKLVHFEGEHFDSYRVDGRSESKDLGVSGVSRTRPLSRGEPTRELLVPEDC